PSGYGRVTRVLRARFPDAAITVCDIDRAGVAFASARFGARGVCSLDDFRLLELGEAFDLIWVGSLITHFPELQTRRFFDCLVRHLASGWDHHHDVLVLRLAAKTDAVSEPSRGFARLLGAGRRSDPAPVGMGWFETNYREGSSEPGAATQPPEFDEAWYVNAYRA